MYRFFIEPQQFETENPVIRGPEFKHLSKVLRLGPGDIVYLLDGTGRMIKARIELMGKEEASLTRLEEFQSERELPLKVTLVQGLAKGDKMDLIIQKATELGIAEIIPMTCRRTVVRLEGEKAIERQKRWQRVAMEAAKQCRRAIIPMVQTPQKFEDVLAAIPREAVCFMPWEEEHGQTFGQVLSTDRPEQVYLLIGPEGGFESMEVEKARQRGVVTVTLGPRILRTETAGLACLSIIMHRWGDLG